MLVRRPKSWVSHPIPHNKQGKLFVRFEGCMRKIFLANDVLDFIADEPEPAACLLFGVSTCPQAIGHKKTAERGSMVEMSGFTSNGIWNI